MGPIVFSRENCSQHDGLYALECFIGGKTGDSWLAASAEEKETQVVSQLRTVFGSNCAGITSSIPDPVRVFPLGWKIDRPMRNVLLSIMHDGASMDEPLQMNGDRFGGIFFVGAERAAKWKGHMEGAVQSGLSGARQVIGSLHEQSEPLHPTHMSIKINFTN